MDDSPLSNDCADPQRLAVLESFGILDTPSEQEFDDLCVFAAQLCNTPMAVINFLDGERQWFKSEVGMGTRQHPLLRSVCRHTIQQEAVMVVPDLLADPRFAENLPDGNGAPLRFYAGAVIRTVEGVALGTVCVFDHQPRRLAELQTHALQILARQVATLLDLRRQARGARQLAATRARSPCTWQARPRCVRPCSAARRQWSILCKERLRAFGPWTSRRQLWCCKPARAATPTWMGRTGE